MLGKKRELSEKNENKNAKFIKLDENAYLLSLKEDVQNYIHHYENITTDTFKEKLIWKSRLDILECVLKALDHDKPFEELECVLANIWDRFKNSIVSYTALPEDEITLLLCKIADTIGHKTDKPALSILMPGVSLDAAKQNYPDLENISLKDALKTHIISQCGQYLVPIHVLLDMTLLGPNKFDNPYYDHSLGAASVFIQGESCERLLSHSNSTQALAEAKSNYNQALSADQSLYSQLVKFCRALSFNSTEGIGSEENAGSQTYAAIIAFNDYFNKLDNKIIESLPTELRNEIEKILNLSSDSHLNFNATQNIETCIATRRKCLFDAMAGHENQLMKTNPGEEKYEKLLIELKNKFLQCQQQLKFELSNGYSGADKYPISKSLMNYLNVTPAVTTEVELTDLLSLNIDELHVLLSEKPGLAFEMARILDSIEKLVIFFINTSYEKLEFVFSKIKKMLQIHGIVKGRKDFAACLTAIDDLEKFKLIFRFLFSDIENSSMLIKGKNLRLLLEVFSPEQRRAIFSEIRKYYGESFFNDLPELGFVNYLSGDDATIFLKDMMSKSNGFDDFSRVEYIFSVLSAEKKTMFFNLLKENSREDLIMSSVDCLGCHLESLPTDEGRCFLNKTKRYLGSIVVKSTDLKLMMSYLSPEKRKIFLKEITGFIDVKKIINCNHFINFINVLTLEELSVFVASGQDAIIEIFNTEDIYESLIFKFSDEQKSVFFNGIKGLINIEDSCRGINDLMIMNYYSIDECKDFSKSIKRLVKNVDDFVSLSYLLDSDKLVFAFNIIKKHIRRTDFLNDPFCLGFFIQHSSLNDTVNLKKVISLCPEVILKGTDSFKSLLEPLSPRKRHMVFSELKNNFCFAPLFKKSSDFQLFNCLSVDECDIVLESIKGKFNKKGRVLKGIFKYLSIDKANHVFNFLKEDVDFKKIIESDVDLDFLNYLPTNHYRYVLDKIDWPDVVEKTKIVSKLLCREFIDAMHTEVFSILKNFTNIISIYTDQGFDVSGLHSLANLDSGEFKIVVEMIGDQWPLFIKNGYDIFSFFIGIYGDHHAIAFKELKKHIDIRNIIKEPSDIFFIKYLPWDEFDFVLEQIKDLWPKLIENAGEFLTLLNELSQGKRMLIFNEVKNNPYMVEMFENFGNLETMLDSFSSEEAEIIRSRVEIQNVLEDVNDFLFFFNHLEGNAEVETANDSNSTLRLSM